MQNGWLSFTGVPQFRQKGMRSPAHRIGRRQACAPERPSKPLWNPAPFAAAMVDVETFAQDFPQFCDAAGIRVPNLNAPPPAVTPKYRLEKSEEGMGKLGAGVTKDPTALTDFIKVGPEGVAPSPSSRLASP